MPWWGFAAAFASFATGVLVGALNGPGRFSLLVLPVATVGLGVLRRSALRILLILITAAFLLGVGRASLSPPATLPPAIAGLPLALTGTIDDEPVPRTRGVRIAIAVDEIRILGATRPVALRALATVYTLSPLQAGDRVLLTGRLRPPDRFEQFDYRTFLADEGIAAVLDSAQLKRSLPGDPDPVHAAIIAIRHGVVTAVDRILPEPQAALVLGVVYGYRAALPAALDQAMITSGLIHIVVISGLKVSLLARLVHRSVGRLWPAGASGVALAAMVVYALVAGASAAALRATAMGALVVVAGVVHRDSQVYVSMALTAAIMLGLRPALAHDVSFQLSFAGTVGIAMLTDPIARRLSFIPALLRDPFAATCAAELATWPLMLANFHQLSLIGPVANALVLPLLPAIITLGGLGAPIALVVPEVGWLLVQGAGLIGSWFQLVITLAARVPAAAVVAPYFPLRWLWAAALLNGSGLLALRLRVFFWQRRVWAMVGGVAVIAVALLLVRPDGRLHVYALDVGTGSAVLIRTPAGDQMLVDAGPDATLLSQALGRALPPTARRLSDWIITGGRLEHIGGAGAVLDRFQVDRILVADPDPWTPTLRALVDRAQRAGIPVATTLDAIAADGVDLIRMPDQRTWLVRQGSALMALVPPQSDWVRLPQDVQGAIYSSGGPSDWDDPSGHGFAVIQVATHSRAGLPARPFLSNLGQTTILRTDRLGSVEIEVTPNGFQPAA